MLPRDQPGVHRNRDFDRRGLSVNIDDQIIQSVLRKRKGEVFAERRGRDTLRHSSKVWRHTLHDVNRNSGAQPPL